MDEQLRQGLEEAGQLILSADARLRFYAYVPGARDDVLEQARADWQKAETILWDSVKEREQVVGAMDAFTNASAALALLMDTLAVGLELSEGPPPDVDVV
jgi:hypothetical protein